MAMQTSLFGAFIEKFFGSVVGKLTETFNGQKKLSPYLYERMLDEEYSADLTWTSTEMNNSVVAADVVSMDSALPLKKRGTIRSASGDIPKIGIKRQMREKAISDVLVMQSKGLKASEIAAKVLNNVPRVIEGVKIRLEILFEQALSTGVALVKNEDNSGTGVRADFGYKKANQFKATKDWATTASATPIDDLHKMFDAAAANGDTIVRVLLSEQYFGYARKTPQVRELVAASLRQTIVDASAIPVPPRQATLDALKEEFGAEFEVVNTSYKIEGADGKQTTVKPWEQGNVVGITSEKVGRLVWGTLAEEMNKVAGVAYQKSNFILVSQYSHNEPSLAEFTAAQALALPVIDDGGSVYVLDAKKTS